MTAEVAIMNTRGIALAADSAVTLGVGKTYNTADKLFALSKYHPVGIMIYSSASIMGIDWEVIIKNYRDHLRDTPYDHLSEYAENFINYLSKFPYFTQEQMLDYLEAICFEVFSDILTWFIDDLHKEFDGKENIELAQINNVFNTSLKNIQEKLKKSEDEKAIKLDTDFIDSNSKTIQKMLEIIFENFQLSKKQIAEITGILKIIIQKGEIENFTGIVIAGYGEREIFPVLYECKISGKLGDSLIYFNIVKEQIDVSNTASIIPFAQTEMVHQFARGIDREFKVKVIEKVDTLLIQLSPLINDSNKEKITAISNLLEEYLNNHSHNVFVDPILEIVNCMQTSELVSMAEAMVNLTALKRHVSTDKETVGGPVDVALITRGEGFIWIKKKTNYDPHLNRHLNQKYFRGDEK
jgi:regulator of sigma D